MQTAENVSYAKPAIGGAAYTAPLGTTLPTDAKTPLPEAYKPLGYISEDGLRNIINLDTDSVKAWGGDVVLNLNKGKTDTSKVTFLEMLNPEVLKTVHGRDNVTGTIDTMITVKSNNAELGSQVMVFDMILKGGYLKRIVVPDATVTDIGEIEYADSKATGYEVTITATADTNGDTHIEYIEKPSGG